MLLNVVFEGHFVKVHSDDSCDSFINFAFINDLKKGYTPPRTNFQKEGPDRGVFSHP